MTSHLSDDLFSKQYSQNIMEVQKLIIDLLTFFGKVRGHQLQVKPELRADATMIRDDLGQRRAWNEFFLRRRGLQASTEILDLMDKV